MQTKPYLYLILILLITSCQSPQKLFDKGYYDEAIEVSARKLKKKYKEKHAVLLEKAFKTAMTEDFVTIDSLKTAGQAKDWEQIQVLYSAIQTRQNRVKKVLPLRIKGEDNRLAVFKFVNVEEAEAQARENAAGFLYTEAEELLEQAALGDKMAARQAYENFEKIEKLYSAFRKTHELIDVAYSLGVNYVSVELQNKAFGILPFNFERNLMTYSRDELPHFWVNYDFKPQDTLDYDLKVVIVLNDIEVGQEQENRYTYQEQASVQEGTREVRDTSGAIINEPVFVTVNATVTQLQQQKGARLLGEIYYWDESQRKAHKRENLYSETTFENVYCTFYGDRRALGIESQDCIAQRAVFYPTDDDMLEDLGDKCRFDILRSLELNKKVLTGE